MKSPCLFHPDHNFKPCPLHRPDISKLKHGISGRNQSMNKITKQAKRLREECEDCEFREAYLKSMEGGIMTYPGEPAYSVNTCAMSRA
jgi:MoaA/NifB/PqqE/SkfB family radical SAM enzyme